MISLTINLRTWNSDTRIRIISSATESKRILCNLPVENQLFGYIHYCTEIPKININLLPNTCSFSCSGSFFHYIFLRMCKMCILEKLNFKISQGSMPSDPPSVLTPLALDPIFVGLALNCFRQACYYHWVILSIILRILRTEKYISQVTTEISFTVHGNCFPTFTNHSNENSLFTSHGKTPFRPSY